MKKKGIPLIPSFIVSDSVKMGESKTDSSFMYCPDVTDDKLDDFKKSYKPKTDDQYIEEKEFDITFERKNVKDLIHLITSELKRKGTKVPLLILPFRPKQHDADLKKFLNTIFVKGMPIKEDEAKEIIKSANEYILMGALKFIWCRLPGKAIIGWKAYTEFVKMEDKSSFPDKAFLEFMPNCLSSGAHASIVYDFFDLIVALILNSKENLMTAKKLSKLCGLWAFSPVKSKNDGIPSFQRGLYEWIPAGDAMFHLLLAFVKSMPPNGDLDKLPRIFQNLLKSTEYPPPITASSIEASKNLQEIPMVTIRSTNPSKNPFELLNRVNKTLKFDDPTLFYTREDYLLLKRVFKDKNEISDKLSAEGARLLDNLCLYDSDLICDGKDKSALKFKLVPGWSTDMTSRERMSSKKDATEYFTAVIGRVTIEDYFIWTWLASLGIEQTDLKKKTFGKTYIMEVELAEGFRKWIIVEEQDLARDGYDLELELKQEKLKQLEQEIKKAELEAKRIKKQALLDAERVEIERHEAKKKQEEKDMLEKKMKQAPPPLPKKDYGTNKETSSQTSKIRKPPPSITVPESSSIIEKTNPNTLASDQIRISLPNLDEESTFLNFDTLGIDFNFDSGENSVIPKLPKSKVLPTVTYNKVAENSSSANYNNYETSFNDKIPERSPRRRAGKVVGTYNPYPQNANSPQINRNGDLVSDGNARNINQTYDSQEKHISSQDNYPANYLAYTRSPLIDHSPPRTYSPNREHLSPRTYSPNREQSPPRSYSPPRSNYPPRANLPPTVYSPPHSSSPLRSPEPSNPYLAENQRSPVINEVPTTLPNQRVEILRDQSRSPDSYHSDSNISYETNPTPKLNLRSPKTIPILPPPEICDERFSADKRAINSAPITNKQLETEFEDLEAEFKNCMNHLDAQKSEYGEARKVSNSRIRKAPPPPSMSMKESVVSRSSSVYPASTVETGKPKGVSKYLSVIPDDKISDHSRESSNHSSNSNTYSSNNAYYTGKNSPMSKNSNSDHSYSPNSGTSKSNITSLKMQPFPQSSFSSEPVHYSHDQEIGQRIHVSNNSAGKIPTQYYSPQVQNHNQFSSAKPPNNSIQMKKDTRKSMPPPSRGQMYPPPPQGQPPSGYPQYPTPPQGYPPYPLQGYPPYPPQGYPPQGYPPYPPQGYPPYPPQGYPPYPSQGIPQSAKNPSYSNNIINSMPPSGKIDKLHGPQAVNKKNARNAFMGGGFGI
ncbi:Msb1 protein [Pichia kluyveri]|uniref:Msb1 protein n=1 Tax=Pichia kluyveri TaxID=36015 RepID=A0AAV5R061_PICKL|nr:Msb1 protein [Pichia kluyveri]